MALTDEQMHEAFLSIAEEAAHTSFDEFMEDGDAEYIRAYGRAIEAAACAERDARIAELEAANEAFGKRQDWWNNRMVELERQLAEARNQALEDATKCCDDLAELNRESLTDSMWEQEECAAAIRAMKKEQT